MLPASFFGLINLDTFNERYISTLKVGKSGYAYMINPKGVVIAYPDKEQVLNLDLSESQYGKEMLEKTSGSIEYTQDGVLMEGVYRNNKATGWTLALVLPKAELFAAARKIGLINLAISIVVVVVLAIALLYLTRVFVTKPLAPLPPASRTLPRVKAT